MGLDINGVKFILYAKTLKVHFGETVMIGRQGLHLQKKALLDLVRKHQNHVKEDSITTLEASKSRYADDFLRSVGAYKVDSLDNSDYEGANLCHDMNLPIPENLKNKFDVVLDGGSLEHVFDIRVAFQNCMEMVKVGGHFLGINPANNFMGHGFYQFSPEFYFTTFSRENGFEIEKVILFEDRKGASWYEVFSPESVRGRVILKNSEKTYLLVIAKKIEEKPIFSSAPQQSDYKAIWTGQANTASDLKSSRTGKSSFSFARVTQRLHRFSCWIARKTYFEPRYFQKMK
jgi:SAM-dependent methyltransferase